jgi:ribosome-binding ATPase YchF (GTP1/OBG family)
MGLEDTSLNRLIRFAYDYGNLISFLTAGEDEVRSWTIIKGSTAQKAAGAIHSDIEKGFIRAEVVAFEDFKRTGSDTEAKKQGLYRLEGKEYIVKDGDLIEFRFNV